MAKNICVYRAPAMSKELMFEKPKLRIIQKLNRDKDEIMFCVQKRYWFVWKTIYWSYSKDRVFNKVRRMLKPEIKVSKKVIWTDLDELQDEIGD